MASLLSQPPDACKCGTEAGHGLRTRAGHAAQGARAHASCPAAQPCCALSAAPSPSQQPPLSRTLSLSAAVPSHLDAGIHCRAVHHKGGAAALPLRLAVHLERGGRVQARLGIGSHRGKQSGARGQAWTAAARLHPIKLGIAIQLLGCWQSSLSHATLQPPAMELTRSASALSPARAHASISEAYVQSLGRVPDASMSSRTLKARCSCPARPAAVTSAFHTAASVGMRALFMSSIRAKARSSRTSCLRLRGGKGGGGGGKMSRGS